VTFLFRRWVGVGVSTAALGLGLAGCGGSAGPAAGPSSLDCVLPKAPLAVAVGARANSPNPTSGLNQVSPLINTVAGAEQPITLIRLDGSPEVFFQQTFSTTAGNGSSRQSDLNNFLGGLNKVLNRQVQARVAQADVLTALTLAAQSTHPGGNVVLIDSGLQTTAPLDFRHGGLLDSDPADVVRFLRGQHLLPDLSGRHVLLVGFGDTAAPQQRLDLQQQQNVMSIWRQMAMAAGATCVGLDNEPSGQSAVSDVPAVGLVPVPAPPEIRGCGQTVFNASNHVNFVENTATFIDPSGARATLQQLADKLQNGRQRVNLIGSTATWGPVESRIVLSDQRAGAVKQVLVSMGIAADRIHTVGDGSNWPGRVPDIGSDGQLLPGPAAEDREVIAQLTCPAG
jgi:OOP family OmpA-OmpF porin